MRILPTICSHNCNVSRVSRHSPTSREGHGRASLMSRRPLVRSTERARPGPAGSRVLPRRARDPAGPGRARSVDRTSGRRDMSDARPWPSLLVGEWRDTRDTLQLWLQIVGKIRMSNTALMNHWWNVPLYVTAEGFTTSMMQHQNGESFQIDLDLREHILCITTLSGSRRSMPLQSGPVSAFYADLM